MRSNNRRMLVGGCSAEPRHDLFRKQRGGGFTDVPSLAGPFADEAQMQMVDAKIGQFLHLGGDRVWAPCNGFRHITAGGICLSSGLANRWPDDRAVDLSVPLDVAAAYRNLLRMRALFAHSRFRIRFGHHHAQPVARAPAQAAVDDFLRMPRLHQCALIEPRLGAYVGAQSAEKNRPALFPPRGSARTPGLQRE